MTAIERFDEFLDLLEEGKGPDFAQWVERYPDQRAELEQLYRDFESGAAALQSSTFLDSQPLSEGEVFGRFRLVRRLGSGGQGEVWEAVQTEFDRSVALKVFPRHGMSEGDVVRFRREGKAVARIDHPNVIKAFDAGEARGYAWLSQELVPGGRTLAHRIREVREQGSVPRSWYRAAPTIAQKVAAGLAASHAQGVVHRDVKPQNVLLTEGEEPKVSDFGLARLEGMTALSRTNQVVGTYLYMSPEHFEGQKRTEARSDVFSLGVVLYEMLTLQTPFQGDTPVEIGTKVARLDPPSPKALREQVPGELAVICAKAMEKSPADRYATMAELADDLERYLQDRPIVARPPGRLERTRKWMRRNPARATAVAIAALAFLAVSTLSILLYATAEEARANYEDVLPLSDLQRLDDLIERQGALWPPAGERIPELDAWLADASELIARRSKHTARRDGLLAEPLPDADENSWWISQLSKLLIGLDDLEQSLVSTAITTQAYGYSVRKRLEISMELRNESSDQGEHAELWATQLPAIEQAYGGLKVVPQRGLVPLGRDPESKLWEFVDVTTGTIPVRRPDGRLDLAPENGLVFVLLPGGTFLMGAQSEDPALPHYDPEAKRDESPLREVELEPFFLSKYEVTQAQWERLAADTPSRYKLGPLHPVEYVSWIECQRVCRWMGYSLPTEAQWEYAARGGTDTVWPTGDERASLLEHLTANLADRTPREAGMEWGTMDYSDGHLYHAPVDALAPNPFGLHHMQGNLWEWCLDGYEGDAYRRNDSEDGPLIDPVVDGPNDQKVFRGGAFLFGSKEARPSHRTSWSQTASGPGLGFRPARALDP